MNEQSPKKSNGYWQFIVDGWPVISAIVGVSWIIALILADNYVTKIHEREYQKTIISEPIIASINATQDYITLNLENGGKQAIIPLKARDGIRFTVLI